jgi:hypothetical protein
MAEALIKAKENELFASKNELSRYRAILDPRTLIERGLEALYPPPPNGKWSSTTARYAQFLKDHVVTSDGKQLRVEVKKLAADLKCKENLKTVVGDCNSLYDRLWTKVHDSMADSSIRGWLCGGSTAGCANTIVTYLLQGLAPGTLPSEITVVNQDFEPVWILSRQGARLRPWVTEKRAERSESGSGPASAPPAGGQQAGPGRAGGNADDSDEPG